MGLRPSKTVRDVKAKQIWTRLSQKKPRKSFIKGAPRPKVRQYHMGADRYYELQLDSIATQTVNVRDNSLESARQAATKYLEKKLMVQNFYLTLLRYPHIVVREHNMLGVAGADRISKGMKKAFGAPKGRMMQVKVGEPVFRARILAKDLAVAKKAFQRAFLKLSGSYTIKVTDITNDPLNKAKRTAAIKMFKKKETAEEKKKAEEAAAAPEAAKAEGEVAAGAAAGESRGAAAPEGKKIPGKK